jgi:hypothetical protein
MKNLIAALTIFMLTGCSTIVGLIPSFNDTNQSAKITDVRFAIDSLDCAKPQNVQVKQIVDELRWFELYSESAGIRNQDVIRVIKPMQETAGDFLKMVETKDGSRVYCDLKKRAMQEQAARAAKVILGRF